MSLEDGEIGRLNPSLVSPDHSSETPLPAADPQDVTPTDTTSSPRSIRDFVGREDFPRCVLGETVDIGGRVGVVVQIVNQSLKVKPPEGPIQSFNAQALRKLYGTTERPPVEPVAPPTAESYERPKPIRQPRVTEVVEQAPAEVVPRVFIAEPDFSQPVKPITEFIDREDFPKCAYGQHVEIGEFAGVVVELVKQSLKIRDANGYLRSYNGPVLRKLYGKP